MASGSLAAPSSAKVQLVLEDGSIHPTLGTLQFSDITVDPGTGSIGLRAVFPNPGGTLLPGLYVRARLEEGTATRGVLVPQAAVSREPKGGATVYVADPRGKAQLRPVKADRTVGDKWLVTAGLQPGERVIVQGLQNVRPGGAVQPSVVVAAR